MHCFLSIYTLYNFFPMNRNEIKVDQCRLIQSVQYVPMMMIMMWSAKQRREKNGLP